MTRDDVLCTCGHPYRAHRHLRRGTDCALCGAAVCPRFRRPRWWRRPADPAADKVVGQDR